MRGSWSDWCADTQRGVGKKVEKPTFVWLSRLERVLPASCWIDFNFRFLDRLSLILFGFPPFTGCHCNIQCSYPYLPVLFPLAFHALSLKLVNPDVSRCTCVLNLKGEYMQAERGYWAMLSLQSPCRSQGTFCDFSTDENLICDALVNEGSCHPLPKVFCVPWQGNFQGGKKKKGPPVFLSVSFIYYHNLTREKINLLRKV